MRRMFARFRAPASIDVAQAAFAPLTQAQRCLDAWLREENRSMTPRQRQRAGALIARYFEHEESVTDQLILSFLRHYAGMGAVDLEDPQAVRLELKAVLDRSMPSLPAHNGNLRLIVAVCTGMMVMASVLVMFYLSRQTLTLAEQNQLRSMVAAQADARDLSTATIWAAIKRDLGVARYQDIRRWDLPRALEKAQGNAAQN